MNPNKKRLVTIAAGLVLVAVIAGAVLWFMRPTWPEFAEAKTSEPQVVIKVERDYAHHLGDLIEVNLFVRQQPGTTVDARTLSIGGDFELSAKPDVTTRELEDGSVIYRFKLGVQSFKVKPAQILEGSIGWKDGDKRKDLVLAPLPLHWSNTYDGRENLMEGTDPRVPAYWYIGRHALPLALSSLAFLTLLVVALSGWLRSRIKEPVIDEARNRVGTLLAMVKAGKCTKQQHLELDGLVRDHFRVGPIPAGQLEGRMLHMSLIKFLRANEPAVYAEDALDTDAQTQLHTLGHQVLRIWG